MERTFELQWAIQSPSGATNLRRAGCIMRWGCAFERAASAGGAGRMPLVSGMTSQSSGTHWCRCWSLGKGVSSLRKMPWCRGGRSKHRWNTAVGSGAGRRPSISGLKIEPYCQPRTHDFLEHQTVFGAIVVLTTQLSFVANPLFQVAY